MVALACYPKLLSHSAEIQRIVVPGQTRQKKVCETPILWGKELGTVVHACRPSYEEKCKIGALWLSPGWAKSETLSQK
jgi:hypothetical protein